MKCFEERSKALDARQVSAAEGSGPDARGGGAFVGPRRGRLGGSETRERGTRWPSLGVQIGTRAWIGRKGEK